MAVSVLSGRTFRYIGNNFNHSCPFCGSFFCNQIYFGTYKDFILKPLFHIELFGHCQERTSIFSKEKLTLCQKIIFCCALFIGPESDHWQCLSLTHWFTHSFTHSLLFSKLDWCDVWLVKRPTQNLLRLSCCWCWW